MSDQRCALMWPETLGLIGIGRSVDISLPQASVLFLESSSSSRIRRTRVVLENARELVLSRPVRRI